MEFLYNSLIYTPQELQKFGDLTKSAAYSSIIDFELNSKELNQFWTNIPEIFGHLDISWFYFTPTYNSNRLFALREKLKPKKQYVKLISHFPLPSLSQDSIEFKRNFSVFKNIVDWAVHLEVSNLSLVFPPKDKNLNQVPIDKIYKKWKNHLIPYIEHAVEEEINLLLIADPLQHDIGELSESIHAFQDEIYKFENLGFAITPEMIHLHSKTLLELLSSVDDLFTIRLIYAADPYYSSEETPDGEENGDILYLPVGFRQKFPHSTIRMLDGKNNLILSSYISPFNRIPISLQADFLCEFQKRLRVASRIVPLAKTAFEDIQIPLKTPPNIAQEYWEDQWSPISKSNPKVIWLDAEIYPYSQKWVDINRKKYKQSVEELIRRFQIHSQATWLESNWRHYSRLKFLSVLKNP